MVKVRNREPGADRPRPKGHGIVEWNPRRRWHQDPIGRSLRFSTLDNRVTRPAAARRRYPRKETAEGVEDAGGSEGSAVMAETGPRQRGYPARKDFRRVSAER